MVLLCVTETSKMLGSTMVAAVDQVFNVASVALTPSRQIKYTLP